MAKPKIKARILKKAEKVGFVNAIAGRASNSLKLLFLSNLGANFKHILASQQQAFQYTGFVLNVIPWLIASFKLVTATNKNINKVENWLVTTAKMILAGVLLAGVALAPAVSMGIFFTLLSIDTAIAIGKTIYFAIKAQLTQSPDEKQSLQKQAKENAITAATGLIIIAAFVVTVAAAPYVGVTVLGAVGVIGASIVAALGLFAIGKAIYQTFFKNKANESSEENLAQQNELSHEQSADSKLEVKLEKSELTSNLANNPMCSSKNIISQLGGIQQDSPENLGQPQSQPEKEIQPLASKVNLASTIALLKKEIDAHLEKIGGEQAPNNSHRNLWSQAEKRTNKINALGFLKEFVEKIENGGVPATGTIEINGQSFQYNNKEELISKIDDYVTNTYPGVYQSFLKDIGTVENLFKQTYAVIKGNTVTAANLTQADTITNSILEQRNSLTPSA